MRKFLFVGAILALVAATPPPVQAASPVVKEQHNVLTPAQAPASVDLSISRVDVPEVTFQVVRDSGFSRSFSVLFSPERIQAISVPATSGSTLNLNRYTKQHVLTGTPAWRQQHLMRIPTLT